MIAAEAIVLCLFKPKYCGCSSISSYQASFDCEHLRLHKSTRMGTRAGGGGGGGGGTYLFQQEDSGTFTSRSRPVIFMPILIATAQRIGNLSD